jgi:hypothetical protein
MLKTASELKPWEENSFAWWNRIKVNSTADDRVDWYSDNTVDTYLRENLLKSQVGYCYHG